MSLANGDVAHLLLAFVLLLVASHGLGQLFARFHQPRVAGEILGGLLLGPTLFGLLWPGAQNAVFETGKATQAGLGIVYQLGLLLLMYCSGAELRSIISRGERKSTVSIAALGNVVPFVAGLAFLRLYDTGRFLGPAGNRTAFALVFALAMAVTSIPVISRIMADLGILNTRFARIVLSVAVLEDVLVYVVLNVALALVVPHATTAFGLPGLLGIKSSGAMGNAYYVVLTLAFFALPVLFGPGLVQKLSEMKGNALHRSSPIAFQLVMVLAFSALAAFLGVSPIFGALVAGILASDLHGENARARQTIQSFSYAFFVPLYFAVVGLRLDLINHFDPLFFVFFLLFACLVKSIACYFGARMTGETHTGSKNLAVALNARGGPGIVLASVAFDAKIIDERFYTILIMLALVTSVIAGSWLGAILKRGDGLLTDEEAESEVAPAGSSGADESREPQPHPVEVRDALSTAVRQQAPTQLWRERLMPRLRRRV
jgi:Kef-type K+ transport system membrane component KefB